MSQTLSRTPLLHIVLFRPLIPPNTGTIGRNCLGVGARLHLVKPYGFDIWDDRQLKRAGLDYWKHVDLVEHDSVESFVQNQLPQFDHAVFFSKHKKYGSTPLLEHKFPADVRNLALMFGNEVQGIDFVPPEAIEAHPRVFLPMRTAIRSYNLASVAAVGIFEAIRQCPELYKPSSGEDECVDHLNAVP